MNCALDRWSSLTIIVQSRPGCKAKLKDLKHRPLKPWSHVAQRESEALRRAFRISLNDTGNTQQHF